MPLNFTSYDEALAWLETVYENANYYSQLALNESTYAYQHYIVNQDHAAISHLCNSTKYATAALDYLIYKNSPFYPPSEFALPSFIDMYSHVNWQNIINAWIYNEYEGAVPTVYVLDKMKKEAWVTPFSLMQAINPELQE